MSDCASKRLGEKDDYEILLSRSDVRETSYRKHSLWMSHWTRNGNDAEPQNSKSYCPFEEIDDVGYSKDCGNLPFELMKARVAERFMVGVGNGGTSSGNTRQLSSDMWGVAHDVYQEVQCNKTDQFDMSSEGFVVKKNVNLFAAKTVVSEKNYVHKPSDSYKVLTSDNLSSEWSHFPMFSINRKIDTILNPRRSALAASSDKIYVPQKSWKPMSASNAMAFSSKEYQFRAQQAIDENMSYCKSARGSLSHQDDRICLDSDHAGKTLRSHLTVEESRSCSKDETTSLCSLADKLCGDHYFNPKGSSYWSDKKKFVFSESRKENEIGEVTFLEQNLGTNGECQKQQYFDEVPFHEPVLTKEYENNKPVNTSYISKRTDVDIKGHDVVFANLLQLDEQHHPRPSKVDYEVNLIESCILPDTIEKTLSMKSQKEALACKKSPEEKSAYRKQKGPCLYEMLTLPSKSHVTCSNDPTYSGKFCSIKGSCLLGGKKQLSSKNDTLYIDIHHASKSTAGFASSSMQKDSGCTNAAKTERVLISSVKRLSSCCEGNETANMGSEHHNSCSKATCASKQEWSIPKTSSMNLDQVLFQISRMRHPISKALTESPICSDPSDKWLKRLKHDSTQTSDHQIPCSKRRKIGVSPSRGETCVVFGGLFAYDRDITGMIKPVEENQLMHDSLMEQQNPGSPISEKNLNHWIGRWCQGGVPTFHGSSHPGKLSHKSYAPSDCLDNQFPSIHAMAMMGRVMNKLRPCELEKKGPAVVWKTDGL